MIIEVVTICILLIYSIIDIKYKSLNNKYVLYLFTLAVIYNIVISRSESILAGVFLFIFGYFAWSMKTIGGADAKILPSIGMLIPYTGYPEMLVRLVSLVIVFGVLSSLYGIIYIKLGKKAKRIPLMPIFLMTYILIWIWF